MTVTTDNDYRVFIIDYYDDEVGTDISLLLTEQDSMKKEEA
jgi:hypothetical protein